MSTTVETTTEIRPFHAEIPQAELATYVVEKGRPLLNLAE
jgi:hypothetical protein